MMKPWQTWLDSPKPGAQIYFGSRIDQFGLVSVRTKMRLREVVWRTGGEPEKLTRRLKERDSDSLGRKGLRFHSIDDQSAELNELVQRSFRGGKHANVARIGDPNTGYLAKVERNPEVPGFFPELLIVHPEAAYVQEIPVSLFSTEVEVGLVAIHLSGPMAILDGQTRLQGAIRHARATGSDWALDQEAAVCIIPGIPIEKAQQIFVTVNATPVPVGFDHLVDRDRITRAYELTRYVIERGNLRRGGQSIVGSGRGRIRKKAVYQFVMQTLLGGRGEARSANYLLEDAGVDLQKETLLEVLGKAEQAIGSERWGDTDQLLIGGYGLAAMGRLYYETTLRESEKSLSFGQGLRRVAEMDWHVSNPKWLDTGLTAVSRTEANKRVSKLTSFDMIRRAVDIILGPEWGTYRRVGTSAVSG